VGSHLRGQGQFEAFVCRLTDAQRERILSLNALEVLGEKP
jgi:hypothetical protein